MTQPRLRAARTEDAASIAALHADSWRRHYRGAFADAYLDGDVPADRLSVWESRLADRTNSVTIVAEDDAGLVGFVHTVLDEDVRWGSLVDNLHVTHGRQRTGIGATLLTCAAEETIARAASRAMHLWVLEQNVAAQRFYLAMGGTPVETAPVPPPGGVPDRLTGSPRGFRIAWQDAGTVGVR